MAWLLDKIASVFGLSSLPIQDLDPAAEMRARLARYDYNWQIYKGNDLKGATKEDGTPLTDINILGHNIDKANFFAWGKGYTLTNSDYQTYIDAANESWGVNWIEKLLRMAQFGSVTGDAFLMAAPVQTGTTTFAFDDAVQQLVDTSEKEVAIVIVNSRYCTPYYDPFDMDKLVRMDVIVPVSVPDGGAANTFTTTYSGYTITKEKIVTWQAGSDGSVVESSRRETPNPIGDVFAVHIRNYPLGDSLFGKDDLRDAERLNRNLTEAINGIDGIIKYHGDPITIIYGAKASNLKKGPNKIWGNLPKDGKVENLVMNTDLGAIGNHIDRLKESLHVITSIPEVAQGTKQNISNTSGVALHTMYLPLIERAMTKWAIYSPKLIELVVLVLKWQQALKIGYTVEKGERKPVDGRTKPLTKDDYENILRDTVFVAELPLPKDHLIEVQVQNARVEAGLQTRRDALVALGESNPDEKLEQIKADKEEWGKLMLKITPPPVPKSDTKTAPSVESGAGGDTGIHKTESDVPQGRPKGTTKE